MFFSFLRRGAISFFTVYVFFFPVGCFAFEASPSVSDLSFSESEDTVTQVISVLNTEASQKTYEARLVLVAFASDGSIADFFDVPHDIDAHVFPEFAEVSASAEQAFTVEFSHPEKITADQVFGLVIHEQGLENQELSSAFVALIFPRNAALTDVKNSFRIDAFTIVSVENVFQAIAQFTNTGDVVIKPTSILVARDMFGRELFRSVFADQVGRLPVGTTRVIADVLPYNHFGFWHVGGPVLFSLLSVADDGGGFVQQASVEFMTTPGNGVIGAVVCAVLFFIGGMVFFWKRRGILRA